jgi:hypothetical protein
MLTRNTLYPQKLALTLPTSGGRSVQFVSGLRPRSLLALFVACQPLKGKKIKALLVTVRGGSHIFQAVGSQMAVRLSAATGSN